MNVLTQVLTRRESVARDDQAMRRKAEFEKTAIPELSRLYAAAVYLTRNKTDAEDLVQETYLRALSFFDKFTPGTNCRAWLLSIMRNLFIDRYRQRQYEPAAVDWETIDDKYESMVAEEGKTPNTPRGTVFLEKFG